MKAVYLFTAVILLSTVAGAQNVKVENMKLVHEKTITFVPGTAELNPESIDALHHVKQFIQEANYISMVRIEGHVSTPGRTTDQALSEQRALAVANWMKANGITCARLLPVGFGNTKPIAPNDTPENRSRNNRIDFVFAALKGNAIGGMPVDGGGKIAGDLCK